MQKYGIIEDGQLVTSIEEKEGYKPIKYAGIPNFNQTTEYVIEKEPIDRGDYIYVGVEVKDLKIDDNERVDE